MTPNDTYILQGLKLLSPEGKEQARILLGVEEETKKRVSKKTKQTQYSTGNKY